MDMSGQPVYFDNNATTRVDKEVLEAMLPFLTENYGNAASKAHAFGWRAQAAVEKAAEQVAGLVGCEPEEIIFTSGATESVNLALKGIFEAYASRGKHIITCKTEHKAVLDTCRSLEKKGALVTCLDVDREGLIDLQELRSALRPDTILVSIMAANNETGVRQPVEDIAALCSERNIIFFSDATQLVGKERCNAADMGVHCMALSAHKFYGPKGAGALFVKRKQPRVNLVEQINGGGHQGARRSGTLNVPGIVGLGKAAEVGARDYWDHSAHLSRLRNYFEHQLLDIDGVRINGSTRYRLCNTSNLTFHPEKKISSLLTSFAFSSGSACSSGSPEPSHVLSAMGLSNDEVRNSFRFSFGKYNTLEEVQALVEAIKNL
jgi:cysteine desulfurase